MPKNQKANRNDNSIITKEDKTNQKTDTIIALKEEKNASIYIGVLEKIYEDEDYFLPLYFKPSISESFYSEFHTKTSNYVGKLISKTDDHERYEIETAIAEKYFQTNGLDTIIVFNKSQRIIDTLYRKNYEYFSDQIESQVIVSYEKTNKVNQDKDYLSMTKTDMVFRKKLEFKKDTTYLKNTLSKNSFKPTHMHSHYKIAENNDTISFMSFGIYTNETQKECFYLFKNKKPIDSIINEYAISKMVAVPIFLESENLYVSYEFIPDTGSFWTSLIGIDLKNNKLKNYTGNRFYMKTNIQKTPANIRNKNENSN